MASRSYSEIKDSLRHLYLDDPRPWLVGFSGGKDSTLVAALVFDAVMSIPAEQRTKPVTILCTDTRVEIPAIAEGVEDTLDRMRRCSQQHGLNIDIGYPKLFIGGAVGRRDSPAAPTVNNFAAANAARGFGWPRVVIGFIPQSVFPPRRARSANDQS